MIKRFTVNGWVQLNNAARIFRQIFGDKKAVLIFQQQIKSESRETIFMN